MLLIRDALVVTEAPFRGWVSIEGNRIFQVGRGEPPKSENIIDARGGALIAGLINTHAHSHSSLTRGSAFARSGRVGTSTRRAKEIGARMVTVCTARGSNNSFVLLPMVANADWMWGR